jgi:hypothetical protein
MHSCGRMFPYQGSHISIFFSIPSDAIILLLCVNSLSRLLQFYSLKIFFWLLELAKSSLTSSQGKSNGQ